MKRNLISTLGIVAVATLVMTGCMGKKKTEAQEQTPAVQVKAVVAEGRIILRQFFDARADNDVGYRIYGFPCNHTNGDRFVAEIFDYERPVVVGEKAHFGRPLDANVEIAAQHVAESVQHSVGQFVKIAEIVGNSYHIEVSARI